MSNRTFSIKKGREISKLEAQAGSIKRLLRNPLGRRRNSSGQRTLPTTLQAPSATMPKNKSRRGESSRDWEEDGTEESYVNVSDGNRSNNRAVASPGVENGNDRNNDRIINDISGGRPRRNRGSGSPQYRHRHGLDPWIEAVSETSRIMDAAHKSIKDLQGRFESHVDDLQMMEETKDILAQLKEESREKDDAVQRHAATIRTLTDMNGKTEETRKQQEEILNQERTDLEQEKAKLEKRVTTAIAEQKHVLMEKVNELATQQGQSYDKRKKELEDDFAKRSEENNRQVIALGVENGQLSTTVEKLKATVDDQAKRLKETLDQCDLLKRAKYSYTMDLQERDMELNMLKSEFALNSKSKDYFKRRFAEIHGAIEEISSKYFSNIDGKDLDKVHKQLVAADPCFASVPIDDSEDSISLRVAHAQRIISNFICEYIWKPLRSEFTWSHPDYNNLLVKILDELEKSSNGGRAASVWTALTMRVLQSLPASSVLISAPDIKGSPRPTGSNRAEAVFSKVSAILSPLVVSPDNLRTDLLNLAKYAIETWNEAQTGELKIIVSPSLNLEHREEWRDQKLDPLDNHDEIRSETHNRIFTLFPRVVAWEVASPVKPDAAPPGGWPSEFEQGYRRIETCIHPGVGLPEWSPLVVRGKDEQERGNEFISKAIDNAKKELHSNRRNTGHGRRDSKGSFSSITSTPSQAWNNGGVTPSQRNDT